MKPKINIVVPIWLQFPTEEEEQIIEEYLTAPFAKKAYEKYLKPLVESRGREWTDYWIEKKMDMITWRQVFRRWRRK